MSTITDKPTIERCKRHGLTEYYPDGRCKQCRKEINQRYVINRRVKQRQSALPQRLHGGVG